MAIFDRFKKEEDAKNTDATKSVKKAPSSSKAVAKSEKTEKAANAQTKKTNERSNMRVAQYADLLIKPHISEKAAMLGEKNVYVFDVPLRANKVEIKKAVEAIYGVSVIGIRTQRGIGKAVKRGRIAGRRSAWKKALVQLKKGQTLNLVEGV